MLSTKDVVRCDAGNSHVERDGIAQRLERLAVYDNEVSGVFDFFSVGLPSN